MVAIPEELPKRFQASLRRAPSLEPERLLRQIEAHEQDVARALQSHEFIDETSARALARVSRALLALELPEAQRHLAFAAIDYFVLDDDDAPDLQSPYGFDDDVQVMNWVVAQLDRPDLTIVR